MWLAPEAVSGTVAGNERSVECTVWCACVVNASLGRVNFGVQPCMGFPHLPEAWRGMAWNGAWHGTEQTIGLAMKLVLYHSGTLGNVLCDEGSWTCLGLQRWVYWNTPGFTETALACVVFVLAMTHCCWTVTMPWCGWLLV
eukprot:jgi/Ulvmu1/8489/UM044_0023.1